MAPAIIAEKNQAAKPKRKFRSAYAVQDDNVYTKISDIIEDSKKLFPQLEEDDTTEKYLAYLKAMQDIHGVDKYILKDPKNLAALYSSFARTASVKVEANEQILETSHGGKIHVKKGQVSYEGELQAAAKKGWSKTPKFEKKPFTMENAYDMALQAMHDATFHHPNRIRLKNVSEREFVMIQIALAHVSKELMPKNKPLKVAGAYDALQLLQLKMKYGIKDNYHGVMFRGTEQMNKNVSLKDKDPNADESGAEGVSANGRKVSPKTSQILMAAGSAYRSSYENLSPEQEQYNLAKDLLLEDPHKYVNGSPDILASDLAKLLSVLKVEDGDMNRIMNHLLHDSVIETDPNRTKITKIADKPPLHDEEYNKIASKIIHNPDNWKGSRRQDVAQELFGKKTGLSKDETTKLKKVWDTLKGDGIVKVDEKKNTVNWTNSALAGTQVGAAFARSAHIPEPPAPPEKTTLEKIMKGVDDAINVGKKGIDIGKKGFDLTAKGVKLTGKGLSAAHKTSVQLGTAAQARFHQMKMDAAIRKAHVPHTVPTTGANDPHIGQP